MNVLDLCFACHEHIHRNPKWATGRGLLLHTWDEETPYVPLLEESA